jgi:hypothetical protein
MNGRRTLEALQRAEIAREAYHQPSPLGLMTATWILGRFSRKRRCLQSQSERPAAATAKKKGPSEEGPFRLTRR